MIPHRSLRCVQALTLAGLAAELLACAAAPPAPTEQEPAVPRVVRISVECDGDANTCYGSRRAWESALTDALNGRISALVFQDSADSRAPIDWDFRLRIETQPDTTAGREVAGQSALLDALAWVTVPLLPLWIEDVDVQPAVRVFLEKDGSPQPELDVEPVRTHMLERYPFLSWQTFGALLLPPFAYTTGDPTHLSESIASEVRAQVVAGVVDAFAESDPLVTNIDVRVDEEGQLEIHLSYQPEAQLGRVDLQLVRADGTLSPTLERGVTAAGRHGWTLQRGEKTRAEFLRVAALTRRGERSHYTVRLPPEWPR